MKDQSHFKVFFVIFFIVILLGTFAYHFVEGWNYLDSLYFVVITATTIGYGDIVPQTDLGKIFTMFFSFFGIIVVFYAVSIITGNVFRKYFGRKVGQLKKEIKKQEELKEDLEDKKENKKKTKKR